MPAGGRSFFCLCSPKSVENLESNSLSKQLQQDEELRQQLNSADLGPSGNIVLCLPGGGICAEGLGNDPEVAMEGPYLAVLSGSLNNYAYLIRKYFVQELGYPRNVSLESIRHLSPIRDAALLCKLYERLGTGMLPKLKGPFCFCLYDSSTRRVLTARDPTSCCELLQGETKEGALFVSAGGFRPKGSTNVVEIKPGEYKYGWRSGPRKYANPQNDVDSFAAAASSAARAALSGIKLSKTPRPGKQQSVDEAAQVPRAAVVPEVPKLRTKKEIRAWSAQLAQEAIKAYELGGSLNNANDTRCGQVSRGHPGASIGSKLNHYEWKDSNFTDRVVEWNQHAESLETARNRTSLQAQFQPEVLATLQLPPSVSSGLSGPSVNKNSKSDWMGNSSPSNGSNQNSGCGNSSCDSSMTASESHSSLSIDQIEKHTTASTLFDRQHGVQTL